MGLYSHVNHLLEELIDLPGKVSYDFSDDFSEEEILRAIDKVNFGFFSVSHLSEDETKAFLKNIFS